MFLSDLYSQRKVETPNTQFIRKGHMCCLQFLIKNLNEFYLFLLIIFLIFCLTHPGTGSLTRPTLYNLYTTVQLNAKIKANVLREQV